MSGGGNYGPLRVSSFFFFKYKLAVTPIHPYPVFLHEVPYVNFSGLLIPEVAVVAHYYGFPASTSTIGPYF